MQNRFSVATGTFDLQRLPENPQLQAWDGADLYLLEYLADQIPLEPTDKPLKILILNDHFGALAIALNRFQPTILSDSYLSYQAMLKNLELNQLTLGADCFYNSLQAPKYKFDYVLIKVPKTLALLEDQLIRLYDCIDQNSQVIAAAMVKNLSKNVSKLLEKYLGSVNASLAKKKARLLFTKVRENREAHPCPYPVYYDLEGSDYRLCNHANVFSRDQLDIGTRFLLANLPEMPRAKEVIDLGCGNGVVGILLAKKHPHARIHFIDESYMAVASAKETYRLAFPKGDQASFQVADGLSDFKPKTADLIVCNPPFHQHHSTGDQIAQTMFKQARKVLRGSGEFWVIGNRHLNYQNQLKKIFGNASLIASNNKFVICRSLIK